MVMNEKEAKRWHLYHVYVRPRQCPTTLLVQMRRKDEVPFPTSAARTSQKKSIAGFPMCEILLRAICSLHDNIGQILYNNWNTNV